MVKVFITGATGYIGGEILYQLLENNQYEITALVRSEEKARLLLDKTEDRVKTVLGDLDSVEILTAQVELADLVINAADVNHLASVQNIAYLLLM